MNAASIETIISGDLVKSKEILQQFAVQHANTFDFSANGQKSTIWSGIFRFFQIPYNSASSNIYPDCLAAIRILSRDKVYLNENITIEQFNMLLNLADLGVENAHFDDPTIPVEALKCLCNIVYQSGKCQMMCLKNSAVDGIMRRLRTYKDANVHYDIQYYDMKLLFLMTALNANIRIKVRDDHHGLTYLAEILDLIINERSDTHCDKKYLNGQKVDLLVEVMKVLFNITVRNDVCVATEEEEETQFRRLAVVLHDILLCRTTSKEKQNELCANAINLLTNVPGACYSELVTPSNLDVDNSVCGETAPANVNGGKIFDGNDVSAIDVLLDFLKYRLDNIQKVPSQKENELLSPILMVMVKCARCNSLQRHYLKSHALPPLHDVRTRPEVGDHLKNRLVKLLTTPMTQVRDLVADFLFVLCKENVGRLIKYTGYGNAAGHFANRGLLPLRNQNSDVYSSDSEGSDTEEYKEMRHQINPVVGCYEPPRPSPFEGMSEEQKEYEAMKLVNLMQELNRQGIVQPCRIGEDGRPVAVEHILELQDNNNPHQQPDHQNTERNS